MKRRIAFFVCLVLVISVVAGLFSYSRAADVDYKYVRVKISIGTPTSFSFFVDGNYSVSGQALERQLYTVRIDGSQLKLCLGDTTVAQGSTIYITRHQGTPGRNNIIWLNNSQYGYRQYLGDMSFSIQNGAIQLVNRIPMEEYLYGVVPHEMSNSFPPEALKSQAVAARNYTVRKISSSGTYDVTDLASKDQVYKGYDASENFAIAAVNATAGQVLKSGSTIIQAYYSASNGGMTELPYHRWGGGGDWRYYDIQPDPYDLENPESLYETISFPVTIDANHPVTSKGNDGTPNTTVAVNYIKTAILNSGKLAAYGVTNISQFELSGVTSLEAHTHESPASTNGRSSQDHSRMPITGVNNCIDMVYATGSFTVTILPAGSGTVVSVTNVDFNMRSLNGSDGSSTWKAFHSTRLGILVVEPVYSGGTLTGFDLSQRRFGHACGLSQRGAEQRAKSSDPNVNTYDKILAFYYPNTTLEQLYDSAPSLPAALPSTDYTNGKVVNVTSWVNVRSGPSTSYSELGRLPAGARLELMEAYVASDWYMFSYGGRAAYIQKTYVQQDVEKLISTIFIRRRDDIYVTPRTTCSTLVGSLKGYSGTVTVRNASGTVISGNTLVGDGSTITLTDSKGNVLDRVTARLMRGDVNGDGRITTADYAQIRLHVLQLITLDSYGVQMADINGNGVVDIGDYTLLRLYLLGLWNFS